MRPENPGTPEQPQDLAGSSDLDRHSSETLLPVVYDELRRLAAARLKSAQPGQSISGTVLVHEAYLRLHGDGVPNWANEKHFFSVAAEAMRCILIDHLRAKGRIKRGGDQERVDETLSSFAAPAEDDQLLAINDALDELAREDPEAADLVKMRFFVGFTLEEIAESTGVTVRTVSRQWKYVRAWLTKYLGSQ